MIDITHPEFEEQIRIVNQTLQEIHAADKRMIYLFNKIDAYRWVETDPDDLIPPITGNIPLNTLKASWMARENTPAVFISALNKTNFEELRILLYHEVKRIHETRFPFDNYLY